MTAVDDNWPSIITNLRKSRKVWYRLSQIMGKEVADWRISGQFYVAFMQATLLLRLETWVVTPRMAHTLGGVTPPGGAENTMKLLKQQPYGGWE